MCIPQQFSVFNLIVLREPASFGISVNIECIHNVQFVVAHCVLQVGVNHLIVIGILIDNNDHQNWPSLDWELVSTYSLNRFKLAFQLCIVYINRIRHSFEFFLKLDTILMHTWAIMTSTAVRHASVQTSFFSSFFAVRDCAISISPSTLSISFFCCTDSRSRKLIAPKGRIKSMRRSEKLKNYGSVFKRTWVVQHDRMSEESKYRIWTTRY